MTKYLIGMFGALGGMLVGAWLMLAPFALAYQPSGADWAAPTYTDFWSGMVILVVSLIGLLMYILGLGEELRRLDIIERKEEPRTQEFLVVDTPVVGGTPAGANDIGQILLPLVTAMLEDMQDHKRRREENDILSQSGAAPNQQLDSEKRP